jgi:hypothetical protein
VLVWPVETDASPQQPRTRVTSVPLPGRSFGALAAVLSAIATLAACSPQAEPPRVP